MEPVSRLLHGPLPNGLPHKRIDEEIVTRVWQWKWSMKKASWAKMTMITVISITGLWMFYWDWIYKGGTKLVLPTQLTSITVMFVRIIRWSSTWPSVLVRTNDQHDDHKPQQQAVRRTDVWLDRRIRSSCQCLQFLPHPQPHMLWCYYLSCWWWRCFWGWRWWRCRENYPNCRDTSGVIRPLGPAHPTKQYHAIPRNTDPQYQVHL